MLKDIQNECLTLPGISENIQWGKDRGLKVGGKMFCCIGAEAHSRFSFKVDEERFLELIDQPGVVPAPYLARARWVQVDRALADVNLNAIKPLVKRSYRRVVGKLPKKDVGRTERTAEDT